MDFIKKNILWTKSKFKIKLINQKIKTLNVSLVESRSIINNDNLTNNNLLVPHNGVNTYNSTDYIYSDKLEIQQKNVARLSRNKHTIGTLKHYPPAIKEWYNSIYSFYPNNYLKLLPSIDKSVYNILKGYFNLDPLLINNKKHFIPRRLKKFSMIKLFLGKPEIKHSNNKVIITVYIYNRKKIYFLNKIKKIIKIHTSRAPGGTQVNKFHFNKFKSHIRGINPYNLTKMKNYKLILSLILIKDFKFKLSLINSVSLQNSVNNATEINKKSNLIEIKTLKSASDSKLSLNKNNYLLDAPLDTNKFKLKNKKLLYGELRLLKKKLKKLNRFLFNVLKNKPTPFLFMYLKKKLPFLFIYLNIRPNKINTILLKPFFNISSNPTAIKILNIGRDNPTTYKKLLSYKYYCSMLYFNSYIFNANNLLPLKDILKKIYNKKIEFNIINLKYLYLDSGILAQAISIKLKDRQKRILRILKLGLKLTKKPNFKIHFHKKNKLHFLFSDKKLDLNINSVWGNTNSIQNKYLIFKPDAYKMRIFLYHMKQKIISGIRIQGTGRLTKRLTASRSLSKVKYKGSLKNLNSSYENVSTVMLRGFVKSNLQYVNINNSSGNGSFGVKVSISVY